MTRVRRVAAGIAAAGCVAAAAAALEVGPAGAHQPFARARLALADGTPIGTVRFWDARESDATVVDVRLAVPAGAAAPGAFHGFHIHANDDPANGSGCIADPAMAPSTWFVSVDGHLKHDPAEMHGGHAGDLPTLYRTPTAVPARASRSTASSRASCGAGP
jgi:superoxide dismutase, Cu-Zn family